jgi:MULE transposase domain
VDVALNDDVEIRSTGDAGLLLVHQNIWQRRLLARYGQTCLLDATCKTTKYALPLFFPYVRTNMDYIVVAEFVVQHEDTRSIFEVLSVVKSWNPDRKPSAFMVDCCEAETNALENLFTGAITILIFSNIKCFLKFMAYIM